MRKKILIVDDEPEIREIVGFGLSLEGYTVVEASGGKEAIEIIQKGGIDAIVSDVRMPRGDGISLAKELQKLEIDLPMILMTGYTSYDLSKVNEIGVREVFTKPFETNDLISVLEKTFQLVS